MKHHLTLLFTILAVAFGLPAKAVVTITTQPQPATVLAGDVAVLTVFATGTGTLSYQWKKNGAAIAEATNAALVFNPFAATQAGSYSVDVSDASPSTLPSSAAALTVKTPAAGDVDFSFPTGEAALDGSVLAVAEQSDGKVLIAGFFATLKGAVRGRIARLNSDGSTDHSFGNGLTGANGNSVIALAVQSDGKVLIGGSFTAVNGTPRFNIARLNSDGTLDISFSSPLSASSVVYTMAVQGDGKVLVGGTLPIARGGVTRLNSDGTLDTSFGGGLAVVSNTVYTLATQNDGKVLVGGSFTNVNGTGRSGIARLNSDGTLDTSFTNVQLVSSSQFNTVEAIAVQGDNRVLIGGRFTNANGTAYGRIARLNSDGTLDNSFGNGLTGANGNIYSIAVQGDGRVVVGGTFTTVNGTARGRIARLNSDGTLDSSFGNGTGINNAVEAIVVQGDGQVLVAGQFSTINGAARRSIALLDSDGTLNTGFDNGSSTGFTSIVNAMVVQNDGQVLVGGTLPISRFNRDGSRDPSFANVQVSEITTIAVQSDGKVLIGCNFTAVNGVARGRIARLHSNGTLDTSFGNGLAGADNVVRAIAVQNDGRVLIGGFFNTVNGTARRGIARLHADGTLDTSFGNGLAGADSRVDAVIVQSNGKVVIGGLFTNVNGTLCRGIARLNSDGTLDTNGVTGANGSVAAQALQGDGKVVVGGSFTTINGIARGRIARLNTDGTLDLTFSNALTGANGSVDALAMQGDGKVVIGGSFTTVSGIARGRIARLHTDGTLDTSFGNGLAGANGSLSAVAVQSDDRVLIGGAFFTVVNGVPCGHLMRLWGSAPASASNIVAPTLSARGAVWRYFDKTNDLGTSWRSNSFSDVMWSNGTARLGYGNDGEVTKVASNRQWTTYFRRQFYVPEPAFVTALSARLTRNDAAVIYLNGTEVWHDTNITGGTITYTTQALAALSGGDETNWLSKTLNPSDLIAGWNTLAAEVHNQSLTSSDLGFDFELTGTASINVAPDLSLSTVEGSGGSFVLAWPAEASYFSLSAATNLTPPVVWTPLTNLPVLISNEWRVTLPTDTNAQRYFRLGVQ